MHILPKIKTALSHKRKRFMNIWTQCQFDFIYMYDDLRQTNPWELSEWNMKMYTYNGLLWISSFLKMMVGGKFTNFYATNTSDRSEYSNNLEQWITSVRSTKLVFFYLTTREMSDSFGIEVKRRVRINWTWFPCRHKTIMITLSLYLEIFRFPMR